MKNEYDNYDPKLAVKYLLDNELYSEAEKAIIGIGSKCLPHLIAAISDRRFSRLIPKDLIANQDMLYARTKPLHSVLRVLRRMPTPKIAEAVAHLTSDPDRNIREDAIHLVCGSGNSNFVRQIEDFVSSEDEHAQYAAVTGLLWGNVDAFSAPARDRIFAAVQAAAVKGNKSGNRAPECLLRLDLQRGADFLSSRDSLSPDNPELYWFIKSLLESSVVVPEERLLPLVNSTKLIEDSPDTVGRIVQLLARCNSEVAIDTVFDALKSPTPQVREGAARALLSRAGINDPTTTVLQAVQNNSIESVPKPIAHCFALEIFIMDVANGGLSNYFGNDAGNYWKYAREAMLAIKATPQAALFDQTLSLFPQGTPSTVNKERNAQLRKMYKQDEKVFSSIESELFELFADLEAKLFVFAAANADALKPYTKLLKK